MAGVNKDISSMFDSYRGFVDAVVKEYGYVDRISKSQILNVCRKYNIKYPSVFTVDKTFAIKGNYDEFNIGLLINYFNEESIETVEMTDQIVTEEPTTPTKTLTKAEKAQKAFDNYSAKTKHKEDEELSFVPRKVPGYVPFGAFKDIRAIVNSGRFYPAYITGLSGNGKTMMIEQVHALEGRELIRCNVTIETDEDDLLGGFRLVNGSTVWHDGPVTIAMERGASLLLDEVDLGSNKMMCLQPVMEGKSIFIKKINRVVHPAPGFNVFATANTKGKGSDDGRFIGTNVMNEASLDRYAVTIEHEYPDIDTETVILKTCLESQKKNDDEFVKNLVTWASSIRKLFKEGHISEVISTRRLVNICDAYAIFGKRIKAIEMCVARFDDDTKSEFLSYYKKVDSNTHDQDEDNTKQNPEKTYKW